MAWIQPPQLSFCLSEAVNGKKTTNPQDTRYHFYYTFFLVVVGIFLVVFLFVFLSFSLLLLVPTAPDRPFTIASPLVWHISKTHHERTLLRMEAIKQKQPYQNFLWPWGESSKSWDGRCQWELGDWFHCNQITLKGLVLWTNFNSHPDEAMIM